MPTAFKRAIRSWRQWLLDERRYSVHTVDAYARDLALFTAFLAAGKTSARREKYRSAF